MSSFVFLSNFKLWHKKENFFKTSRSSLRFCNASEYIYFFKSSASLFPSCQRRWNLFPLYCVGQRNTLCSTNGAEKLEQCGKNRVTNPSEDSELRLCSIVDVFELDVHGPGVNSKNCQLAKSCFVGHDLLYVQCTVGYKFFGTYIHCVFYISTNYHFCRKLPLPLRSLDTSVKL